MFNCKTCKGLERENLLLRTQVSDLLAAMQQASESASKERQALTDSFISLLGSKRASPSSSLPRTPTSPENYFPGASPNLRPPYPQVVPEASSSKLEPVDPSSISDKPKLSS